MEDTLRVYKDKRANLTGQSEEGRDEPAMMGQVFKSTKETGC